MVLSQKTERNHRWIAKQSQEKKEQLQEEDRLRAKKNYYKRKAKMQNPEADDETVEQIAARLIANNQQNRHTRQERLQIELSKNGDRVDKIISGVVSDHNPVCTCDPQSPVISHILPPLQQKGQEQLGEALQEAKAHRQALEKSQEDMKQADERDYKSIQALLGKDLNLVPAVTPQPTAFDTPVAMKGQKKKVPLGAMERKKIFDIKEYEEVIAEPKQTSPSGSSFVVLAFTGEDDVDILKTWRLDNSMPIQGHAQVKDCPVVLSQGKVVPIGYVKKTRRLFQSIDYQIMDLPKEALPCEECVKEIHACDSLLVGYTGTKIFFWQYAEHQGKFVGPLVQEVGIEPHSIGVTRDAVYTFDNMEIESAKHTADLYKIPYALSSKGMQINVSPAEPLDEMYLKEKRIRASFASGGTAPLVLAYSCHGRGANKFQLGKVFIQHNQELADVDRFSNGVVISMAAHGDTFATLTETGSVFVGSAQGGPKDWQEIGEKEIKQVDRIALGEGILFGSIRSAFVAIRLPDGSPAKLSNIFELNDVIGEAIGSVSHMNGSGPYVSLVAHTVDGESNKEDAKPAATEKEVEVLDPPATPKRPQINWTPESMQAKKQELATKYGKNKSNAPKSPLAKAPPSNVKAAPATPKRQSAKRGSNVKATPPTSKRAKVKETPVSARVTRAAKRAASNK